MQMNNLPSSSHRHNPSMFLDISTLLLCQQHQLHTPCRTDRWHLQQFKALSPRFSQLDLKSKRRECRVQEYQSELWGRHWVKRQSQYPWVFVFLFHWMVWTLRMSIVHHLFYIPSDCPNFCWYLRNCCFLACRTRHFPLSFSHLDWSSTQVLDCISIWLSQLSCIHQFSFHHKEHWQSSSQFQEISTL